MYIFHCVCARTDCTSMCLPAGLACICCGLCAGKYTCVFETQRPAQVCESHARFSIVLKRFGKTFSNTSVMQLCHPCHVALAPEGNMSKMQ